MLHKELVKKKAYAGEVSGGINLLGNMFNYAGPMLWIGSLIHEPTSSADEILATMDARHQAIAGQRRSIRQRSIGRWSSCARRSTTR